MNKQYIFHRDDLVNLLLNYTDFFSHFIHKHKSNGGDVTTISGMMLKQWTEEFVDVHVEKSSVKVESILDEVDKITKEVIGKSYKDIAKEIQDRSKQ